MNALIDVTTVAAGGAIGATLRYAVTAAMGLFAPAGRWASVMGLVGGPSAAGTTIANLLGCLALGMLLQMMQWGPPADAVAGDPTRPMELAGFWTPRRLLMVRVGLLGSLTTFSTLIGETIGLFATGRWQAGATLLLLNVVAGGACFLLGVGMARQWTG